MKKSCALIGPGQGPKVQVRGEGKLTVRGVKEDEFVQVFCYLNAEEDVTLSFTEDGEYELHPCQFAQVSYEGKNRGFIACVLIGA